MSITVDEEMSVQLLVLVREKDVKNEVIIFFDILGCFQTHIFEDFDHVGFELKMPNIWLYVSCPKYFVHEWSGTSMFQLQQTVNHITSDTLEYQGRPK